MNRLYPPVAVRAAQRCEYCHAPEAVFNFAFQVEHIHPQARGGGDEEANLALACSACNAFKGDAVGAWDEEAQATVPLYHPRNDAWDDHFMVDAISLEIAGKTATGRVTVLRLQMNRVRQVGARRRWSLLGLFP